MSKDQPGSGTVTMSEEQFARLLESRGGGGADPAFIDALLKGLASMRQPGPWDDKLTPARQAELRAKVAPKAHRYVDVIGGDPRFPTRARVRCERGRRVTINAAGGGQTDEWKDDGTTRVLDIVPGSYQYPREALVHEKDGGLVPDGMQIVGNPVGEMMLGAKDVTLEALIQSGVLTKQFIMWALESMSWLDTGNRGWFRATGITRADIDPRGELGWSTPWDDQVAQAAE